MKSILRPERFSRLKGQRGAVIILVAVLMIVFIGFAALAIDVSHLFVVRNELQNAADAGALAGARILYNDDGTVNAGANQAAFDTATANKALTATGALPVDVHWTSGQNTGAGIDVQRGHWSFGMVEGGLAKGFYPEDSLAATNLWEKSTEELDQDPHFVNAVRVKARREDTKAASFFARIFGYDDFVRSAEAVAFIGFAANLNPGEADQPIAVCKQSIIDDEGNYTCATGRMINSGGGTTNNTAAWSNFSQPCETANPPSVTPLVCQSGNLETIQYGTGMGTVNGMQTSVYNSLRECWLNNTDLAKDVRGMPKEGWSVTLPVIDCPSNAISNCSDIIGAVDLDILWINESGTDSQWLNVPIQMETWECPAWVAAGRPADIETGLDSTQRQQCWQEFADAFNLKTADNSSVGGLTPSDLQKTMFFRPSCEAHEPSGTTGGENFGILAKIPVLVQ
jgi:hypothetical protein